MQENEQLNPEELQVSKLATVPNLPENKEELEELKDQLQKTLDEAEADDLDKKTYLKINPTFYIKGVDSENEDEELFKILNPETNEVETRELTDDEKKELLILQLKESRKDFKRTSHPTKTVGTSVLVSSIGRERKVKEKEFVTNQTINKYGSAYKQKRKRKNKMAKTSRKANR